MEEYFEEFAAVADEIGEAVEDKEAVVCRVPTTMHCATTAKSDVVF